jgi:hypothetical protein
MEAQVGSQTSFVWRSICSARELLEHGLLWRVGDGQSINIWNVCWLPTPITYTIQSTPRLLGQQSVLGDLIDHEHGVWKEDHIREVFMQEETNVIINIPLSPCLPPNRLIWKDIKDGNFIVNSAYHLGHSLNDMFSGQGSLGVNDQRLWKFLWSLRVPN